MKFAMSVASRICIMLGPLLVLAIFANVGMFLRDQGCDRCFRIIAFHDFDFLCG